MGTISPGSTIVAMVGNHKMKPVIPITGVPHNSAQYSIFEWCSVALKYRYNRVDTDYLPAEYTENRVEFGLDFSY